MMRFVRSSFLAVTLTVAVRATAADEFAFFESEVRPLLVKSLLTQSMRRDGNQDKA